MQHTLNCCDDDTDFWHHGYTRGSDKIDKVGTDLREASVLVNTHRGRTCHMQHNWQMLLHCTE